MEYTIQKQFSAEELKKLDMKRTVEVGKDFIEEAIKRIFPSEKLLESEDAAIIRITAKMISSEESRNNNVSKKDSSYIGEL